MKADEIENDLYMCVSWAQCANVNSTSYKPTLGDYSGRTLDTTGANCTNSTYVGMEG